MLMSTMPPLVMIILQVLASGLQALPTGQKYEVVIPQQIHAVYKRDTQDKYPRVVIYELHIEENPLILHLERNEDLLADDYTETSYSEDNLPITITPEGNMKDHCHYQGYVENDDESQASISTCSGLNGAIVTQGRRFIIEPSNLADGAHVVYEEEEEEEEPQRGACAVTSEAWGESMLSQEMLPDLNSTKEIMDQLLNSKKYVEMVLVADNSIWQKYGNNTSAVKERMFSLVNYMNMDYKALNIFVALKSFEIWDTEDHITVTSSAENTLKNFYKWKKEMLLPRIDHDNTQLLTNIDFDGPVVGLASVGAMCMGHFSAGVIQDYKSSAAVVGNTLAHEMGHNLGMNHDNNSCPCPLKSCIMAPAAGSIPADKFSKCSVDQFKDFLIRALPRCLLNKPNKGNIITPPFCGNNFLEKDEECDCGTVEECTNRCCDAAACKLKPGAQCAAGECCEDCQLKQAGSACKESLHDCDLPDTCDGKSSRCLNLFKKDGTSCMDGKGYCLHGKCPTMENQCNALWGPDALAGDPMCFLINARGKPFGCSQEENIYKPCPPQDIECGVLFCKGGSSISTIAATKATIGTCKAVLHPYGMVENGIKCGDEMVCYKGACTNKETAYEYITCFADCPVKCDEKGQCHCDESQLPNKPDKCNAQ